MGRQTLDQVLAPEEESTSLHLKLDGGSRVAVIGGGPAGSYFSYFLLDMAERMDVDIQLDIYEPRDFSSPGPAGCNMCGGIVSESLVQTLATEGIILPPTVVQRGIDSYVLHMDVGSVRIETPLREKRIGAVHRGAGPRGVKETKWRSFDGFLQSLAVEKGAHLIQGRVDEIVWKDGSPLVKTRDSALQAYDLLAVAVGINSAALKLFKGLDIAYEPPGVTKTFIREYYLGEETIEGHLGSSMHVFLLDIPRLEFAAIIPKGDYVSVCMLGEDIDAELMQSFMGSPEVEQCMPPGWHPDQFACQCSPRMNIRAATRPYDDRLVFIGDCGVTRLYKDGIGGAYRAAKAATSTAVFQGVAAEDFRRHYWPTCKAIDADNALGRVVFAITRQIQRRRFARRAVLRMAASEQTKEGHRRYMSMVLWDMFTGSAPYREIFLRTLHPAYVTRFTWELFVSILPFGKNKEVKRA
jgi:flavin-dependent dehydrogenase